MNQYGQRLDIRIVPRFDVPHALQRAGGEYLRRNWRGRIEKGPTITVLTVRQSWNGQ